MEVAAAKAPRQLLARGGLAAAAPCPAVNSGGGVVVFFAALVAGALVSACWMSASARVRFPCKHLPCFSMVHAVSLLSLRVLTLDTHGE
jgi:hypothetical protein